MTSGDRQAREMRPISWGSILTFAGIFLTAILSYVGYELLPKQGGNGIATVNVPPYFMALGYIAAFLWFFSLPSAIVIEAYLFLRHHDRVHFIDLLSTAGAPFLDFN